MKVIAKPCGPVMANSYIVWAEGSNTCAVIDPADSKALLKLLEEQALTCTHILLTHCHFDHIWGAAGLKEASGAKIYCAEADAPMLTGKAPFISIMQAKLKTAEPDVFLKEGDSVEAGGLVFRVLETPGHTKGGLSFAVDSEKAVFTGDTLFCESVGRTDFPGGSIQELMDSVFNKLFPLGDGFTVYPGHEETTTVAHEKQYNPLLSYKDHPWFS